MGDLNPMDEEEKGDDDDDDEKEEEEELQKMFTMVWNESAKTDHEASALLWFRKNT